MTKRQRIKMRSRKYNNMRPHIFDKALAANPYMLVGIPIPDHCELKEAKK